MFETNLDKFTQMISAVTDFYRCLKTGGDALMCPNLFHIASCLLPMLPFSLQLPKDQCTESFEKGILRLLNQGDQCETREVEKNLRYATF